MKIKREHIILLAIFIVVLTIRLFFAFKTANFDYDAYFILRHAEHVKENFFPLFNDPLSYGGRFFVFPPLFQYILGFFNLFVPMFIVGKILPNLFISSVVFLAYFIAYEITKDKNASLFTSFITGFIPVFYIETLNNISVYSLAIPLTFLLILFLIRINQHENYVISFIFFLAVFRLAHPSVVLLMMGLLFYLLIIKIEKLKQSKAEIEVILFSTFIILWSLFIAFKHSFLSHGLKIIWQNIPAEILSNYFVQTNILEAIYMVGIIPFITGIYIIYKYMFKEINRPIYILISLALTVALLIWLRMLEPIVSFMFIGIILSILFSQFYKLFFEYIKKTRFNFKKLFLFIFVAVFILTSVLPSINYGYKTIGKSVKENEINALNWLNANIKENSVILGNLEEGFLITSVAKRKNVADENFLLIKDADQRIKDISTIYSTVFETEAVKLLNKYNVKYIYLSPNTKNNYGKMGYAEKSKCFEKVYDKEDVEIYKCLCVLEEK